MEERIIDVEVAKMIFGDDEEMYRKYLFQLVDRDLMGQVEEYLATGEVVKAFETAHTMKGLVQNLALNEFSSVLEPFVEILRDGQMPTEAQHDLVKEKYTGILAYLKHIKENDIKILQ